MLEIKMFYTASISTFDKCYYDVYVALFEVLSLNSRVNSFHINFVLIFIHVLFLTRRREGSVDEKYSVYRFSDNCRN